MNQTSILEITFFKVINYFEDRKQKKKEKRKKRERDREYICNDHVHEYNISTKHYSILCPF